MNYKEKRPWGLFENLLDTDYCKVKEIIINPNHAISYQYHNKRSEVWIITAGTGLLTLEDKDTEVAYGDVIKVPMGCKHRMKNTSDTQLKFVEVQIGQYFGEDDIIRLKDDYGR